MGTPSLKDRRSHLTRKGYHRGVSIVGSKKKRKTAEKRMFPIIPAVLFKKESIKLPPEDERKGRRKNRSRRDIHILGDRGGRH